jgi:hypothetical protein
MTDSKKFMREIVTGMQHQRMLAAIAAQREKGFEFWLDQLDQRQVADLLSRVIQYMGDCLSPLRSIRTVRNLLASINAMSPHEWQKHSDQVKQGAYVKP